MITKPLRIATVCSGIGAPEKALKQLGIDFELVYFSEIDKFADTSYKAIHSDDWYAWQDGKKTSVSKNLGDLTKIDINKLPKDLDLLVGGTPCQDFSVAGKRQGGEIDSETRSSLMWNFVEIIRETKPKAVIWENVPGCLTAGAMKANYSKFVSTLKQFGYTVHAEILNAKEFGVPQNRDRVFVLAIRKDLDVSFEMPKGYDCGIRLKDVLESEVDEKYYLSEKAVQGMFNSLYRLTRERVQNQNSFCYAMTSRDYKDPKCIIEQFADNSLIELTKDTPQANRVYDINGVARYLVAEAGGGGAKTGLYQIPHGYNKGGYSEVEYAPTMTASGTYPFNNLVLDTYNKTIRQDGLAGTLTTATSHNGSGTFGVIIGSMQKNAAIKTDGICPSLTEAMGMGGGQIPMVFESSGFEKYIDELVNTGKISTLSQKAILEILINPRVGDSLTINGRAFIFIGGGWCRIRKLTESECFVLMAFTKDDCDKCKAVGVSNSQLYKQAGNSIVTTCLMAIFGQLYGINWKPLVYGERYKTETEMLNDLPLFNFQSRRDYD